MTEAEDLWRRGRVALRALSSILIYYHNYSTNQDSIANMNQASHGWNKTTPILRI